MAGAIKDGRNLTGNTNAPCGILVELALAGLGDYDFRHLSLISKSGTE
jgi:hypothetical protein